MNAVSVRESDQSEVEDNLDDVEKRYVFTQTTCIYLFIYLVTLKFNEKNVFSYTKVT